MIVPKQYVTILALPIALPIVDLLSLHFTSLINKIYVHRLEWYWSSLCSQNTPSGP